MKAENEINVRLKFLKLQKELTTKDINKLFEKESLTREETERKETYQKTLSGLEIKIHELTWVLDK